MTVKKTPSPAQPPRPDPAEDDPTPGVLHPHKDLPHGKEFGADDDTPQQGGM